jgi:hypothetical protein
MLVVDNCFTGETLEFKNSTELKEFLKFQNPTALRKYKSILSDKLPNIKIDGMGSGIRFLKVEV